MDASDGLLAPVVPDRLRYATGRGSHTTAMARALLHSVRAVHEDTALNGYISVAKMCETRPSMREPLDMGLPAKVIRHEIITAVPKLMDLLSRSGNAGHGIERKSTFLQEIARVHYLVTQNPDVTADGIARMAASGKGAGYESKARALANYATLHSGGPSATNLKKLNEFEKRLQARRDIKLADIRGLASIDLHIEAPRFVTAMMKALMSSAECDSNGCALLFQASDYTKFLKTGSVRSLAVQASKHMQKLETFLAAYATKMSALQRATFVDECEVRLAIHVTGRTVKGRTKFPSQLACLAQAYTDAQKAEKDAGGKLPLWPILHKETAELATAASLDDKRTGIQLIQSHDEHGNITDQALTHAGYVAGCKVCRRQSSEPVEYFEIAELPAGSSDVVLRAVKSIDDEQVHGEEEEEEEDAEEEEGAELKVSRAELMKEWQTVVAATREVMSCIML